MLMSSVSVESSILSAVLSVLKGQDLKEVPTLSGVKNGADCIRTVVRWTASVS